MDLQFIPFSSTVHTRTYSNIKITPSWTGTHQNCTTICFKLRIKYYSSTCPWKQEDKLAITRKSFALKAKKGLIQLEEDPPIKVDENEKGTVAGAVALVIGTSIGSGILALPQKASPAGIVPSSISLIVCWGFLLIEAFLLIEINVNLRRKMRKEKQENELEVISIRTMAQETLGDWGGTLATITYVFLGYTSMIAYSSKSGEIIFHLINLPEPVSGFLFTSLFTALISIGGTRTTDQVNQLLTASMIGLLLAIEVLAVVFGGWSGLNGSGNWGKVPATIPVIIFSLVYHDLAPVLCAYLGGDLTRLRASILLGSLVPLLALLVWDAIALGLSAQADQIVDPVELLMRERWSGVSFMVEAFSLLAVGTSIIGTLLSFSEFFKEQLKKLSWNSHSTQTTKNSEFFGLSNWWGKNKISFTAMAMVIAPTLFVSATVSDAFSTATDIAGGYCMTMLYGILPPAMAWAVHSKQSEGTDTGKGALISRTKPVVFGEYRPLFQQQGPPVLGVLLKNSTQKSQVATTTRAKQPRREEILSHIGLLREKEALLYPHTRREGHDLT